MNNFSPIFKNYNVSPIFFYIFLVVIIPQDNINLVIIYPKPTTIIREKFLKSGGLVSTLETTGQQWDAPNGWAPLQWTTITRLENYGHFELANEIVNRWIQLNTDVFKRT